MEVGLIEIGGGETKFGEGSQRIEINGKKYRGSPWPYMGYIINGLIEKEGVANVLHGWSMWRRV